MAVEVLWEIGTHTKQTTAGVFDRKRLKGLDHSALRNHEVFTQESDLETQIQNMVKAERLITPKRIIKVTEIKLPTSTTQLLIQGRKQRRTAREAPTEANITEMKKTRALIRKELKKHKLTVENDKLLVLNEALVALDVRTMWRLIRM